MHLEIKINLIVRGYDSLSFNFKYVCIFDIMKISPARISHMLFSKLELRCTHKYYFIFRWSICIPKFTIQNADRETILRIEGPFCQCNLCGDVDFQVTACNIVVEFLIVCILVGYIYESVCIQHTVFDLTL